MSQPAKLVWSNTVPWTCQTCGIQFVEAFCGRLRHMCLNCGTLFAEKTPMLWYSPQQQQKNGHHTICETIFGQVVRCTSMGIKPDFEDAIEMGKLFIVLEKEENGSKPSALSQMAKPPI